MNDLDGFTDTLTVKRDLLRREIIKFSELGRFPNDGNFNDITKKSTELEHIEYTLNRIGDFIINNL